jgi:hypothetical protein
VEKEVPLKRIMPSDLEQVKALKEPLQQVIHLFTANGESTETGTWRMLAALGVIDSIPQHGDERFNEIAISVRSHFTKAPVHAIGNSRTVILGRPKEAGDSGGQGNSRIAELEAALESKDRRLAEAEEGFHSRDQELNRLKSSQNAIRTTTSMIMVALEAMPTDSIEDDLDTVGEKLHSLVQKVKGDESTPMGILRKKLKARTGGIEAMRAELGHRPGYRCVIFSEDVLGLALVDEPAVDRWLEKLFEQLPSDVTINDLDGSVVRLFPEFAAVNAFTAKYAIVVASKEWEPGEEGGLIPKLFLDMQGNLKDPPVEVAQEVDIDYSAVQTPAPQAGDGVEESNVEIQTFDENKASGEQSSVAGSSPAGSSEP